MVQSPRQRRSDILPVCCAVMLLGAGGCVSASLASNTGPRSPGSRWSDAPRQMVHVGEQVQFDFILVDPFTRRLMPPVGLADYCVATVGGERIEAEADVFGHFQFAHTFDRRRLGKKLRVEAAAFQQRGGRDFMKVRGQWLHVDSPYDIPDRQVARDSILLTVYETRIELSVIRPPDELEPETGKLRIRRTDGTTTSVFLDKPNRPGFIISGPEPDGYYRVRYTPGGNEVNPIGTTEVEFVIYDVLGSPHYASTTLETP